MNSTQNGQPILVAIRAPTVSSRSVLGKAAANSCGGLEAGMSDTDLGIGFQEIDTDADGLIDFCEFSDWWCDD